ncbi:MAG: hypothetical protein IPJ54_21055 [Saprospiraceae bacterium]|nr:hypothetical protein [Saprospiraceae bacterium]
MRSYAWWQYHYGFGRCTRQRVAMALSELFVVSDKSAFGGTLRSLSSYYDDAQQCLYHYRDLMEDVTPPRHGGVSYFLN